MNVVDTVTAMIGAWPTMYETRADALKHIFTSRYWQWVDGQLINTEPSELNADGVSPYRHYEDDDDEPVYVRVRNSKENALLTWRLENAELLAQDDYSRFTHTCLCIPTDNDSWGIPNGDHLADMPENVQDDWKQAAISTAHEMHRTTEGAEEKTHEAASRKKVIAFLARHKQISTDAIDKRISELEKELEELRICQQTESS
jgi:hypothetical protein